MTVPSFVRLNLDWNADPNDPCPTIRTNGSTLALSFIPNALQFPSFVGVARSAVILEGCSRYRRTRVNDEGWYLGQCRFSWLAPRWGEFYQINGDTRDDTERTPWKVIATDLPGVLHFHFYLRDETFEAKATRWSFHREAPYEEAA